MDSITAQTVRDDATINDSNRLRLEGLAMMDTSICSLEDFLRLCEKCTVEQLGFYMTYATERVSTYKAVLVSVVAGDNQPVVDTAAAVSPTLEEEEVETQSSDSDSAQGSAGRPESLASWKPSRRVKDGLCYKKMFNILSCHKQSLKTGTWPRLGQLLAIDASAYEPMSVLKRFRIVPSYGDRYHLSAGGNRGVSAITELARVATTVSLPQGSFGAMLLNTVGVVDGDTVLTADSRLGGLDSGNSRQLVDAPDLTCLLSLDLTQCWCRVHEKPLSSVTGFTPYGCGQKPIGTAPVISAAAMGVHRFCHATPEVRACDAKALKFILSGVDPGVLDGAKRPPEFLELCTSDVTAKTSTFGNGYCYLNPLFHDTWWRAARLLGPNPRVASYARLFLWMGKPVGRLYKLIRVKSGYYHVTTDKSSSGNVQDSGKIFYSRLMDIYSIEPGARIGMDPTRDGSAMEHFQTSLGSVSGVGTSVFSPGVAGASEASLVDFGDKYKDPTNFSDLWPKTVVHEYSVCKGDLLCALSRFGESVLSTLIDNFQRLQQFLAVGPNGAVEPGDVHVCVALRHVSVVREQLLNFVLCDEVSTKLQELKLSGTPESVKQFDTIVNLVSAIDRVSNFRNLCTDVIRLYEDT